jgi:hypothetical protein
MTEILERPSPGEWSVNWTCGGCEARLRSTGDDVAMGQFGAMGDYDTEFYVECPICQRCKTWPTHTRELPAHVRHAARARKEAK